ncbi:MAG: ABC transporter ATP-binding protein [Thermoprotei archaeon]|nr:MAG: ABC transporter ATP-binding protein [Thermoprotei archaeon]
MELRDVKKIYRVGEVITRALNGVNLKVYPKDFLAIMGPSGSGKTTLLNMIGLLDIPTSGKILVKGVDASRLPSKRLAYLRNRVIGFVFQQFNLINRLTVLENIELPLVARGIPRKQRIPKVKEALLKAGGELSWLKKKPNQLSGGQQQRVAIARALVGDPEIILADEPTGNLDRYSSKTVMETFTQLNKSGQTIIVVTHDPEIASCTKKILLIRDGVIIDEKPPDPDECIINKP